MSIEARPVRVLVVDDFGPWRRFVRSKLQEHVGWLVVWEASDGAAAIQKAQELRPDLIMLDIGLPKVDGIEAARQIRQLAPNSKILFTSGYRSWDIAEEALRTGALGYVMKLDAGTELLQAVEAVLQGKQFVSASLTGHNSSAPNDDYATTIRHCHEVAFYADDGSVVDSYARFIESGLKSENAVIVVVTEAHRAGLLSRLEAGGVDVPAIIEQGSLILLDASDA